jgi:serine/threonine-protein phosphatase 2A catalytic subunit
MPDPAQLSSVPASEPASIPTLDGWIESLMSCKQLAESDVQRLCEKVRAHCGEGRGRVAKDRADVHLF